MVRANSERKLSRRIERSSRVSAHVIRLVPAAPFRPRFCDFEEAVGRVGGRARPDAEHDWETRPGGLGGCVHSPHVSRAPVDTSPQTLRCSSHILYPYHAPYPLASSHILSHLPDVSWFRASTVVGPAALAAQQFGLSGRRQGHRAAEETPSRAASQPPRASGVSPHGSPFAG